MSLASQATPASTSPRLLRIKRNGEVPALALLFLLCWPVALAALVLYPVVWLLLLPFRLLGLAVDVLLQFLRALFLLPARALASRP